MAQLKVGLIGAGNMGQGMALRMLDEGVDLTVCDRNPAALAPLRERGAKIADTPVVLANTCELIIASMPSREVSLAVALGDQGVVNGKRAARLRGNVDAWQRNDREDRKRPACEGHRSDRCAGERWTTRCASRDARGADARAPRKTSLSRCRR